VISNDRLETASNYAQNEGHAMDNMVVAKCESDFNESI